MAGKKNRKKVSGLENPSAYRNAISRLNYAKGKKKGDKGYITPSQALNDFRKYSSVEAIENQIEKYKTTKATSKLIRSYNYYMGYNSGESGYMNLSSAKHLGIEELAEVVENAKQEYTKEIKYKREYNKNVKQSLRDEAKLKPIAQAVKEAINKSSEAVMKLREAETEEEFNKLKKEHSKAIADYQEKFIKLAEAERKLKNKYRKKNKMTEFTEEIDKERLKTLTTEDMMIQVNQILDRSNKRDKYGNPETMYSIYHSVVSNTVSSILDAALKTKIEVDGEEKLLSDVISTNDVDNNKFWKAFHAWENDGSIVHPKNGSKYPDYISAERFFTTKEGITLLNDMLVTGYEVGDIKFI